jgi:phage terminase small subunit
MKTSHSNGATETKEKPSPPGHLSQKTKDLWVWAHGIRKLSLKDEMILRKACEAFDQSERARLAVKKYGMVCEDRFKQQKVRPEVQIEQVSRAQFAKLIGSLHLFRREPWQEED